MPAKNLSPRGSREEQLTLWAFYFFMTGVALTFLFALVYLITI